jgi:hypothetical protein
MDSSNVLLYSEIVQHHVGDRIGRPRGNIELLVQKRMISQFSSLRKSRDWSEVLLAVIRSDPFPSSQQLLYKMPLITVSEFISQRVDRLWSSGSSSYIPYAVDTLLGHPGSPLYAEFFQLILDDALLFDAVVTFCLIIREQFRYGRAKWNFDIAFHSQRAIVELNRRILLYTNCTSDETILSTVLLAACSVSDRSITSRYRS